MSTNFKDLCIEVAHSVDANEGRERNRSEDAKAKLLNGVRHLIGQLWKGVQIYDDYEAPVSLKAERYSSSSRYAPPGQSYKQTRAAYEGLKKLGLIHETNKGWFSPETLQGSITLYAATDELLSRLAHLKEDPFKTAGPNLDAETIILRDKVDGRRQQIEYDDTLLPDVHDMRGNLRKINSCLKRHWADLRITNDDYANLQKRLLKDDVKQPIDFSKWALVRIFSNGSFEQGGRFYRGWWENVPSEYRQFITLDGKRTSEFDYSQLNPHMIYYLAGRQLGEEDAYDRVFNGANRALVKQAFNAMLQASTLLQTAPKELDLSEVDMDWRTLRSAILRAHSSIENEFFKGKGNHLQYVDSCIAEEVMLHFGKMDYPVLPVHDSFIMHYAFGDMGELEEAMRRAFYNKFGEDIPVKGEIGKEAPSSFDDREFEDLSVEEIVEGPPEYTQWTNRNK